LHGILASTEFLVETTLDAYQQSLADTIDSCGRTLLDTINHVLDFSKINSFERNWKKDKLTKPRTRTSDATGVTVPVNPIPKGAPPLLNIYAVIDVASITEEVVEGVSAGHLFDNISSQDITDVSARHSGWMVERGVRQDRTFIGGRQMGSEEKESHRRVEVILDVEKSDWVFMSQPGALRRVIMNVFGNAIKYTDYGMIRVSLKSEPLPYSDPDGPDLGSMVTFTISDTGKGISPDFLRSKLYTPFAQENSLAPGTGLGLSIVRGIVTMLGGTISFRSEIGLGSEVTISLPLMRPTQTETPSSTSSPMSVNTTIRDGSIELLHRVTEGKIITICSLDGNGNHLSHLREAQRCLVQYLTAWFGLPAIQWSSSINADVVIVDEHSFLTVLKTERSDPRDLPGILVLCSNAAHSRRRAKCEGMDTHRIVEFVAKPYGPYKLAKALKACLDKVDMLRSGGLPTGDSVISPITTMDESRMMLDHLELGSSTVYGVAVADESSAIALKVFSTPLDLEPGTEFPLPKISSNTRHDNGHHRSNSNMLPSPKKGRKPSAETAVGQSMATSPKESRDDLNHERRIPRILLVDDNKINLRLLQTFMKKRKYEMVDLADDGKMALDAFVSSKSGYDIIFMDISMPILNGFEATRAIRGVEEQRRFENGGTDLRPPAMIIALTGLASGRDQSEAFNTGFDLYITKPASFKAVAKLLDNWENDT
jgi:signal transduction histidine kinase/CheY-like chemotaxis protein